LSFEKTGGGKRVVVANNKVGGRELKMAQVVVFKQGSRRTSPETTAEAEAPPSKLLEALEATTRKLIASIDDALAKA
jgi:hypothetical protein